MKPFIRLLQHWPIVSGLLMAISLILVIISCSGNNDIGPVDCTGKNVAFADANAIIQSSCAYSSGCHGSGSYNGPGALVSYNQIYNARFQVKSAVASGRMPLGTRLSTDDRTSIVCWIDNGAQNNQAIK